VPSTPQAAGRGRRRISRLPAHIPAGETLRGGTLQVERAALLPFDQNRPPSCDAVERLWHAQFPACPRWRLEGPFQLAWHFSVLLLARCEIQAIDQQWSLHRLALSFGDGQARRFPGRKTGFRGSQPAPGRNHHLARARPGLVAERIAAALAEELTGDLARIRARQANYLRRELDRIDDYFENYERELSSNG